MFVEQHLAISGLLVLAFSISLELRGSGELCDPTMELNLEMGTTLGEMVLTYVDTYLTC